MVTAVLVGCGAMSARWVDAIAEIDGLQLVGFVDVDRERAEARAAQSGRKDAAVGSDLRSVLAAARPDAVFDVATPDARRSIVVTALEAGCHVLSEKPLAISLNDAQAIVETARRRRRIHAVAQNRRYVAEVRRLKRLLDSGALGGLTSLHADFFLAPHFGGFRESMGHVLLLDMAIHTFDVARYFARRRPRSVYCAEWAPANSWYRNGSSAVALFEFEDGIAFDYRGSWCAVGLRTSWESRWRIVCERGTVVWDGTGEPKAERMTSKRDGLFDVVEGFDAPPLDPADRIGGHRGVIEDFVAAIHTGAEPETNGADNINSLAMTLAAVESAETGRRVAIASRDD